MKTVIVYYSMSGNTAYTAEKIARELYADMIEIKPKTQYPSKGIRKFLFGGKSALMAETPELEPYDFEPGKYDTVILGFPVWAGSVTPPVRTFVRDNLSALKGKRVAAFACQSGAGAPKAFKKLSDCLGGERLAATLVLTDPKTRPRDENGASIEGFCAALRGQE